MPNFYNPGQSNIDKSLLEKLMLVEKAMGRDLGITSGFRSPSYNKSINGAKNSYHTRGLASDIDMKGMDEAQRAQLVQSLKDNGLNGFITYDKHPDMLHVDMRAKPHFMHNKSSAYMDKAPGWFQKIAGLTLNSRPGAADPVADVLAAGNPLNGAEMLRRAAQTQAEIPVSSDAAAPKLPDAVSIDGIQAAAKEPTMGDKLGQSILGPDLSEKLKALSAPATDAAPAGPLKQGLGLLTGLLGNKDSDAAARQHAEPMPSIMPQVDQEQQARMASAQQLMAQLLQNRKRPGLTLNSQGAF